MASIEWLVRSALQAWFLGLPWQHTPSVHVESPEPGDKPALPTLTVWMANPDTANASAREIQPGVFLTGYPEARVVVIFRAGTSDLAETFRKDWRNVVLPAAIDESPTGQPVIPLKIYVADQTYVAKLYLTAETRLAGFEETQTRGLFELRCYGTIVFPALSVRAPSAPMSISLELNGVVYQASDFRTPLLVSAVPEDGAVLAPDNEVVVTFDQAMDLASLQLALDEDDYLVTAEGSDERTFRVAPVRAWPSGSFNLGFSSAVRSRVGTPITPFSLSYSMEP